MKTNIKREKIYNYIISHIAEKGYSPTVREICQHVGSNSPSTVHHHIEILRKEGRLSQANGKSRTTSDTTHVSGVVVPLVGNISAGTGSLAVEQWEESYTLPKHLFNGSNLFLLKVVGDSMIEAGINNGDLVVVNKQDTASIGDIIVAYWDDMATVKRLAGMYPLVLHPENSQMEDIVIDNDQSCAIMGKVTGCLKVF